MNEGFSDGQAERRAEVRRVAAEERAGHTADISRMWPEKCVHLLSYRINIFKNLFYLQIIN